MQLNEKQKKVALIGVGIIAFLYIAPRMAGVYLQRRAIEQQREASLAKPSPAHPVTPAAGTSSAPPTIPVAIAMGRYQGEGFASSRQCKIGLELRPAQAEAYFGYLTVMCFVPAHFTGGKPPYKNPIIEAVNQMTPASAVMTGAVKNGDLVFTVDKSIGTLGDGCSLTGTFTVSNFGLGKVVAQWQEGTEGSCQGGQLILAHF